jgi:predicted metallo-beta-lactamase superfamily hydrolase
MIQLEFFQEDSAIILKKKMELMEEKYHNLRKSQHARISGLNKEVKELKSELEFLKANICKGNLFL